MCGIFGFATTKKIPRAWQVVVQLALYNESRGRQSWGVTWLPKNGTTPSVEKDVGEISKNLYRIPLLSSGILVGHTRAATRGNVSKENAHPFSFTSEKNTVVGVHNGGLSNHDELNAKLHRSFAVDSMHIFAHLAEERDMKEINGSGTVVFFKNNILWMSKFNSGQLSVAKLKNNAGIVWSSDEKALETTLDGANLEHTMLRILDDRLYFFEGDTLYHNKEKLGIGQRSYAVAQTVHHARHHAHVERSIRLRIVRDSKGAAAPIGEAKDHDKNDSILVEVDEIKRDIFGDVKISYSTGIDVQCKHCSELTTRRRTTGPNADEPVCLTCLAWEEYGERHKTAGITQ